jgi:hypothetical protein
VIVGAQFAVITPGKKNIIAYINIVVDIHSKLFNPLNAELNPICHLLALLGARHILHVSRIRVNTVVTLC